VQHTKIIEGFTGHQQALLIAWPAHKPNVWTGAQCLASRFGRPMVRNLVTDAMISLGTLPEEG